MTQADIPAKVTQLESVHGHSRSPRRIRRLRVLHGDHNLSHSESWRQGYDAALSTLMEVSSNEQ